MQIYLWSGFHSQALFEGLKKSWAENNLSIICPPNLSDFEWLRFLPKGKIHLKGDFSLKMLQKFTEHETRTGEDRHTPPPLFPDTPVLGVFTSGTVSGSPKLVLYSKKNIESSLKGILSFFDETRITDIFCYPQAFHTFGLILGYMHAIVTNRKLWFLEGKYSTLAHELRTSLSEKNLLTLGTPTHFYDLEKYLLLNEKCLAPSYSCIVGGAPVSVKQWDALQNILKIEAPSIGYGATEASPGITHHTPGLRPTEEGEIGKPLPHLEVQLVEGEGIEFRGESLCMAVIEKDTIQFPKKMLIRDFIEKRDSDGMLIYRGRSDWVLNRGGTKYYLELLESKIEKQFHLKCLCLAVKDDRLGQDLGMMIELKDANQSENILTEWKVKIQTFLKVEYQYKFELNVFSSIKNLPINANGKVSRVFDFYKSEGVNLS